MFQKLKKWVKEVIYKMISKKNIQQAMHVDVPVSAEMSQAIELWSNIYINKAPWLNEDVKSINLASTISGEFARLITLEMESEVSGSARADYINNIYKEIKENLITQLEYANAKGGMIFKPYIKNNEICIDYIQADSFVPVGFDDNGNITSAIFMSQITQGKTIYTRLEYHSFISGAYSIINRAFKSDDKDVLGVPISLNYVREWADIQEEVIIQNIDKPLFSYYKVPIANNIDSKSPLGISCYAKAINLIKNADEQYGRVLWEYEGSEKTIYVDIQALPKKDSKEPKLNKRLFKTLDANNEALFKDYSPNVRDEEFWRGLNKILQRIEFNCGLAYGTISDPAMIEKTATEIKTSKQRSYATVTQMQRSLQKSLDDLIYAIDILCTLYKLSPQGTYEISYKWDDSIVVDADVERQQDRQDVAMGVMTKAEYRAKWYGETEEEAQKKLPQEADVID